MNRKFKILLFSGLTFFASRVFSAPCCGAGFTIPSLITSDDLSQISLSYSSALIHADVFTNGNWRERQEKDLTQTIKIEGAHIFNDRFQIGASIPIQQRSRDGAMNDQSSGFGDISLQLGYEFLPEWNYNQLLPKGISYLSIIAPTGKSIYDSEDGSGIDARGRGFWGIGSGVVFLKKWKQMDMNTNLEVHYSHPKNVSNKVTQGRVIPSSGGSFSWGAGYNWTQFRAGALMSWFYEGPTDVEGTTPSHGTLKRYASGSLLLSFLKSSTTSYVFSYADQTIFGSPLNTSLSKSWTFFYQYRWPR